MTGVRPVTLLISNSIDYVADLLVKGIGVDRVFRYNTDMWKDYRLAVTAGSIEIEDPTGRKVSGLNIAKVFRRSAMRASNLFPRQKFSDAERYAEEEMFVVWADMMAIFGDAGKVVLSAPFVQQRTGKLRQLRVAAEYFEVTPHHFLYQRPDLLRFAQTSVVKSFTFKFADGIGFYSRAVPESDLDPGEPWFLTDLIDADQDMTVAVVRDELFAFTLERDHFLADTIDWRQAPAGHAHRGWKRIQLPEDFAARIHAFIARLHVHFARIDFLRRRSDGAYVFLEANLNGEWGWLDPDGKEGLLGKILYEIDPATPCVPCPVFV